MILRCYFLGFVLLSSVTLPLFSETESFRDCSGCPAIEVSEAVRFLTDDSVDLPKNLQCHINNSYYFLLPGDICSGITTHPTKIIKTAAYHPIEKKGFLLLFRKFELELIDRLGKPTAFYKKAPALPPLTDDTIIAKGAGEYKTEWKIGEKRFVLRLTGKDNQIWLIAGWITDK